MANEYINKVTFGERTLIDLTGDTVGAADVLSGKTAHGADGAPLVGAMPNVGGAGGTISTVGGEYSIAAGYHDGTGKVAIDATEQAKLVPANVRENVTVLGVTGTMSDTEGVVPEVASVTPTVAAQTRTPSAGYNYISQVNVAAIPYVETDNAAGGKTVTIAGV
jgi:hypothetical protein